MAGRPGRRMRREARPEIPPAPENAVSAVQSSPSPSPTLRQNKMHPIRWVPPDATSLLDVGCNTGEFLAHGREVYPHLRLAGVEVNLVALDLARRRLPEADLHQTGAEALPFADASFDC